MGRLAIGWFGMIALLVCSATAWAQEGQEGRRERGQEEAGREGRRRGRREMRLPDELREFIEDFAPGRLEELERLREKDPARAREMMGRLFMEKRRMDGRPSPRCWKSCRATQGWRNCPRPCCGGWPRGAEWRGR